MLKRGFPQAVNMALFVDGPVQAGSDETQNSTGDPYTVIIAKAFIQHAPEPNSYKTSDLVT